MPPIQQLGAVPGTADAVLGGSGFEPEDDGVEFASSGEAADAPRDGPDDFDTELSPEMLTYIQNADLNAREATNVGIDTGGPERDYGGTGAGVGLGREEALTGSTPAYPGTKPPAISVQTPGHIGSIPAERAVDDLAQENAGL